MKNNEPKTLNSADVEMTNKSQSVLMECDGGDEILSTEDTAVTVEDVEKALKVIQETCVQIIVPSLQADSYTTPPSSEDPLQS